jgi:hypothetical protein
VREQTGFARPDAFIPGEGLGQTWFKISDPEGQKRSEPMEEETWPVSKQGATARDAAQNLARVQAKMFGSWNCVSTATSTIAASHGFAGPTGQWRRSAHTWQHRVPFRREGRALSFSSSSREAATLTLSPTLRGVIRYWRQREPLIYNMNTATRLCPDAVPSCGSVRGGGGCVQEITRACERQRVC